MRAELVWMGRRVDMAARGHRRWLVALIYGALAALMAGLFFADHWRTTGYLLVIATIPINRLFFGGYNFGGLVKPFNGQRPLWVETPPPFLLLALRVYHPQSGETAYRSDEREQGQRDWAHYQAYQVLATVLVGLWVLAGLNAFKPQWLAWMPGSGSLLVYGVVLAGIVLALTLPQAILLWTEPDMEAEG